MTLFVLYFMKSTRFLINSVRLWYKMDVVLDGCCFREICLTMIFVHVYDWQ